MSLNQCNFLGYLGADPETKTLPTGTTATNFTVACGEKWRDKNTGEEHERTEWVRCVMYGKRGEAVAKFFSKGSPIYVSGKMHTRDYEKDGVKHYMTEIICDRFEFCAKAETTKPSDNQRSQANERQTPAKQAQPPVDYENFDDDIPF